MKINNQTNTKKKLTLDQIYEPSEIKVSPFKFINSSSKARMLTDKDQELRMTDKPERLQIANIEHYSEPQLAASANFITRRFLVQGNFAIPKDNKELEVMPLYLVYSVLHYRNPSFIYLYDSNFRQSEMSFDSFILNFLKCLLSFYIEKISFNPV